MPRQPVARAFVAVLALLVCAPAAADARTLYRTGFEPPAPGQADTATTFQTGPLVGQGFFTFSNYDSATVTSESASSGLQSVMIEGDKLADEGGFRAGSFARALVYEPLARHTPIVQLSGEVSLVIGNDRPTCGMSLGITGVLNGEFFPNVLIGVRAHDGEVVSYISNADNVFVNGPAYRPGRWARVTAVLDFRRKTVTGFFDGRRIGTVPWTRGMSDDIAALNIVLASEQPIPGVTAHVDNIALQATARRARGRKQGTPPTPKADRKRREMHR